MASSSQPRSGPIRKWATFATTHPWRVVGGWFGAIILLVVLTATVGGSFADKFSVPSAESQRALDTLLERFPQASGDSAQVVFKSDAGIDDPASAEKINTFLAEAAELPEVVSVTSPSQGGTISADGTIAYATIQYAKAGNELETSSVDALLELVEEASTDGFQTEVGGQVVQELPEQGAAELIGVPPRSSFCSSPSVR